MIFIVMKKILSLSQHTANREEIGKLTNMVSNDFNHLDQKANYFLIFFTLPIGYVGATTLLIVWIGPEGIIGLVTPFIFILIVGLVGKFISKMLKQVNTCKDKRVKVISDMIHLLKQVKMYAWETYFQRTIKH